MALASSSPATVKFTVGVPGSGKSYTRTRWIIEEFIPNEEGILYTNLPLNKPVIVDHFVKKGYSEKVLNERIQIIPEDTLKLWQVLEVVDKAGNQMPPKNDSFTAYEEGTNAALLDYTDKQYEFVGPWLYFQDKDIEGSHILFDEIQNFVNMRSYRGLKTLWGNWLSTIRHTGATIEFMTQREARVPKEVKEIAETRLDIVPNKSERLKYLPILNYDYYQLCKGLFNMDLNSSTVFESSASAGGKLKKGTPKKYRFDPRFFKFYNTSGESGKGDSRKKEPWEKLSKFGLIRWFVGRNWQSCILASLYATALYFICFSGGFLKFQHWIQNNVGGNANSIEYKAKKKGMTVEEYRLWEVTEHVKRQLQEESNLKQIEVEKKHEKELSKLKEDIEILKKRKIVASVGSAPGALEDKKTVEEVKELEDDKQKKAYSIVFLPESEDYAILKNGVKIRVGQTFRKGPYEGIIVKTISFDNRNVVLGDDSELYFD
jgi:hypothetical protein